MKRWKIFYFGCYRESGHYLWTPAWQSVYDLSVPDDFPVRPDILDGGLIPPKRAISTPEGVAFLAHINGWTVISFNDRSVDQRHGSHSVFIMRRVRTFEQALSFAKKAFPHVFERITFEITEAQTEQLVTG